MRYIVLREGRDVEGIAEAATMIELAQYQQITGLKYDDLLDEDPEWVKFQLSYQTALHELNGQRNKH